MNEETKVPEFVADLIEKKRLTMEAKQEEAEREKLAKRNEMIEAGRAALRSSVAETLKVVPEWLHQYDATEISFTDDNLENIGHGYNKLDSLWLVFHIPGLAPIQFRNYKARGEETFTSEWRSAKTLWEHREYGYDQSELGFTNGSYWRFDLEFTLGEAQMELEAFEEKKAEYTTRTEEEKLRAERKIKREEEADARHVAEREQEKSEELQLFNVFKDDPVAINLMQAFLLINQERTIFNAQLEDANETMYSIEERWARRAEDLRRQANEAQRRADEERDRASNLQSDLDDAESKLKKTQRGW